MTGSNNEMTVAMMTTTMTMLTTIRVLIDSGGALRAGDDVKMNTIDAI